MGKDALSPERWNWHDRVFKNFTVNEGLPNGAIITIAEDSIGFVWLWSSNGLFRYDGHHFEHITSPVLKSSSVNVIAKGNHGQIWLGTNKGLIELNPQTRHFKFHSLQPNQSIAITDIATSKDKDSPFIWLSTSQGALKFNTNDASITPYFLETYATAKSWRTFSIAATENDSVWLATNQGLYLKQANTTHFSLFDLSSKLASASRISALLLDSSGNMWVGTPKDGVLVITPDLQVSQPQIPNFANEWIYSLSEISPGRVWLGSYGRGIIEMNIDGSRAARIENDRLNPRSLTSNEIWHIFAAKSGLVWVGTSRGLSRFDATQGAVKSVFGDTSRANGISDININAVLEDNAGKIWLGLRKKGIDIIEPTSGKVKHFANDTSSPKTVLPVGAIESLTVNSAGDIFIGSNWGTYQYANGELTRYEMTGRPENAYSGILKVTDDVLWAGGTDGLWQLDSGIDKGAKALNVSQNFTDIRSTAVLALSKNELIVGTWQGPNWINSQGELSYQLSDKDTLSNLLSNSFVSDILYDKQGRLWISTEGNGIFVGEPSKQPKKFIHLSKKQGLASNVIRSMQFDDNGQIWAAGSAGIDVINLQSLEIQSLQAQDGVLFTPYYRQSSIKTSHGELLFGGSNGLTIVDPKLWQQQSTFYPLAITRIHNGSITSFNPNHGSEQTAPILVSAENNELSVEFSSLDFSSTSIKYRYRLKGLSQQWHYRNAQNRVAAFTTLPPGNYQLEIQNTNRLGQWNPTTHLMHVQVLPYWYQTLWAKFALLVFTTILVLLIVKIRTARLQKRQDYLEQEVKKRTLSLQKVTDELATISMTDPLTGMNNRRYLDNVMPKDIANVMVRYKTSSAQKRINNADLIFILIDLDYFKHINDKFGHHGGDKVLIEITHRIRLVSRESDHLIRWGGEEFLLILRESSIERAKEIAERLRQEIKATPVTISNNQHVQITCSIGLCPFPLIAKQPERFDWLACVNLADKALYSAKESGRDAWISVKEDTHNINHEVPRTLESLNSKYLKIESSLDNSTNASS